MSEPFLPGKAGEYMVEQNLLRAEREIREKITKDFEDASANKAFRLPPKRVKALARKAESELSGRIYSQAGQLRRFAEQVRSGTLGRFMSWVYFIGQAPDGPIKIGVSRNPGRRLTDLQVPSPVELELMGAIRGDATVEAIMHSAFAPDHIRGEWFRRSPTILEFLRIVMLNRKPRYPKG